MITVPITLGEEDDRFIQEAVQSDSYLTQSEVVASALDLLKARDELRRIRHEQLKAEIQKAIEQLDRGETVEFTAEDIKRLGRERLAATRPQ